MDAFLRYVGFMSVSSFLDIFPVNLRQQILAHANRKEYKRGDMVYRVGENPRSIYFVEKGLVGLTMVGAISGKEHLMRFFKKGQFFGHRSLFSDEAYHATATVLESSQILLVSKDVILDILERHPSLYKEILSIVGKELRRCEEQHVMILENQILPRVGQAIVYLLELYPEHNWTRQEIANFCASTVSTVIKALAELEDLGLIKQEGRTIHILNREELLSLQDLDG